MDCLFCCQQETRSYVYMPNQAYINRMKTPTLLRLLSDETNLRIINLLATASQRLCVCELVDSLVIKQYNVSKHVRELLRAGLIRYRKEGRWVYYEVEKKSQMPTRILELVKGEREMALLKKDEQRLAGRLAMRQNGKCLLGILNKRLYP